MHGSHIITGQSDTELAEEQKESGGHSMNLQVFPHFQPGYEVEIEKAEGSHGGGDPLIQEQIFSPNPPEEKLGRNAGHEQGAASILIGVAGNESMKSGLPVQLNDLCPLRPAARHLSELI
jgi:hypothetical protein